MKVQKAYSIEESVYNAFDSLTNERNINKSSFIEENIKKFLKDNDMDFVDKLYSLRANPNHIVTVTSQDTTFYFLSDGSKIQKILFMQIFKECEAVNPNEFFSKTTSIFENLAEKIKTIDETKIPGCTENMKGSLDSILYKMNMGESLSDFDGSFNSTNKILENKFGKERQQEINELCKNAQQHIINKEIKQQEINELNDINKKYKSGEFINKSKLEICEVLIHLMNFDFYYGEPEYKLQHLLIKIFNELKDTATQQIPS